MKLQITETYRRTAEVYYPAKYRQIVSMGGSRSSKTYSILQLLMLEMMRRKRIKITVWRDLKNVCRATVMEDFKKIIMSDENIYKKFKEHKQLGKFTYLPTKSEIIFEGADSIGKVLGSAQDISYFNEVTEFSKDVYLQITQRTSDRVLCDYNPSKDFWLESYRKDPDTVFIHSYFIHNSFCPAPIVKQLLSYEPWEPNSYEVVDGIPIYKGHPITPSNQPPQHKLNWERGTANQYLWLVYGLGIGSEKPTRIYRGWKQITLKEFEALEYKSYFGLDFGTARPTALVEVKYNGDGLFYVCPRFYKPITDISESLATILKTKVPQIKKGSSLIICDSAKQTYIDDLAAESYLAIPALKGSGSINSGITLLQGFTISYVPTNEFENEYYNYSWEVDRYGKPTDNPVKADDHYMDALRYVITYLKTYLNIKV